ncbi:MAG TPA: hypothetical protein VI072_02025, partial [Polyangiaceae bacterium]
RYQSFARGLHDAAADHEALVFPLGVAHASPIFPEVAQHLRDAANARVFAAQVVQCTTHCVDAVVFVEKSLAEVLELMPRGERAIAVHGGERGGQMLGGMEEVEDLRTFRKRRQKLPIVTAGVRDLGDAKTRVLCENVREVLRERPSESASSIPGHARTGSPR